MIIKTDYHHFFWSIVMNTILKYGYGDRFGYFNGDSHGWGCNWSFWIGYACESMNVFGDGLFFGNGDGNSDVGQWIRDR